MGIESAIGGALISGVGSLIGGEMTNSSARGIADAQMDFQQENSDTAHQREVRDLRAAGLNPILSAGGPGASTPSGASAPVINSLGEASKAAIQNFSALQSSRQVDPIIDNVRQQTKLNSALTAKAAADTTSALETARNIAADTASKKGSPFLSKFVGSDTVGSSSKFLGGQLDNQAKFFDKGLGRLGNVIEDIYSNSARALREHRSRANERRSLPVSVPDFFKKDDPIMGFPSAFPFEQQ